MLKVFPANLNQLYEMLDFIRENALQVGFDRHHILKIELATEEALVNIINYGYCEKEGEIHISCDPSLGSNGLKIMIEDHGIAFNPLAEQPEVPKDKCEERKVGGLGIFFILKIMDRVNYERVNNSNVLTLVKYT